MNDPGSMCLYEASRLSWTRTEERYVYQVLMSIVDRPSQAHASDHRVRGTLFVKDTIEERNPHSCLSTKCL